VVGESLTRTTTTDSSGNFNLRLPVGRFIVRATSFAYGRSGSLALVLNNRTTTRNLSLNLVPAHTLSGQVRTMDGTILPAATVSIPGTPLAPVTTDANGFYQFDNVPQGIYEVEATAGRCTDLQRLRVLVNTARTLDFALPARVDSFGYSCRIVPAQFVPAAEVLQLSGDDNSRLVQLPFAFPFYGANYSQLHISTNGYANFLAGNSVWSNSAIPSTAPPNAAIYPFWDDLVIDSQSQVLTRALGTAPNRIFVVEWRNAHFYADVSQRVRVALALFEDGRILTQYGNVGTSARQQGNSATIGIENATGTVAFQYSYDEPVVQEGLSILFQPPVAAP
jgi:hypothetical protein